jgi:hypothetical protein
VARKSASRSRKPAAKAASPLLNLPGITVHVRDLSWLQPLSPNIRVVAGERAPNMLRVPIAEANRVLKATIRFVADLPKSTSGRVVWQQGASELAVRLDQIDIAAAKGLITISFPVACDQLDGEQRVSVPIAVGTEERPAGLVMSTFTQPAGPVAVTQLWSESIIAFAWEAIVHLAQQLCAAVGNDTRGYALVPGTIGAAPNVLLLQPMARHKLTWRP